MTVNGSLYCSMRSVITEKLREPVSAVAEHFSLLQEIQECTTEKEEEILKLGPEG
jgi:hypothetical protein